MPGDTPFLDFIRRTADELRKDDRPPQSLDGWKTWRTALRKNLLAAWGGFADEPAPLEAKTLDEIKRDGYRIEKVAFQTQPGVWMPGNLYVPDGATKRPAVLNVHGHWPGAKQDEHVQARCAGLAQHGFVALAVDAFGAGERGLTKNLGEYHGEMTAATLWPTGLPLSGLQVYENMRAVDYLLRRPEVNGEAIGITGASGGGNQTMYAGAYDERFKAVVPVCSVGNYRAYLGAACCMCEVVPAALSFTEEWAILALVAPRALMVVNATRDARQFSVEEAKKSLALASAVFELSGKPKNVRHLPFESGHDYSKAMREAMYGWMTLHLKGEGDGSPIAEREQHLLKPEELRCWPGDSRAADFVTLPRFAAREAQAILKRKPTPDHLDFWDSEAFMMREGLEKVLGNDPEDCPLALKVTDMAGGRRLLEFDSEPGLRIAATHLAGDSKQWVIVVDPAGMESAVAGEHAKALQAAGWNVVCVDLRAIGRTAVAGDSVGRRAPDHNSAEWSLWIGRPLVGQWAYDVRRTQEALLQSIEGVPDEVAVVGLGTGGLAALLAAAQEESLVRVGTVGALATFVSDVPYEGQRLGLMVPSILRQVGDVPHLAALVAPRRLLISAPINGAGQEIGEKEWEAHFNYPHRIYSIRRSREKFVVTEQLAAKAFAEKFGEL
jgi:dienelactone hydrolase